MVIFDCRRKFTIIGADFLKHHDLLVDVRRSKLTDNAKQLQLNNITTVPAPIINTHDTKGPFAEIMNEFKIITIYNNGFKPTKAPIMHQIITNVPPVFFRPRRLCPDKLKKSKGRVYIPRPARNLPNVEKQLGQSFTHGEENRRTMETMWRLQEPERNHRPRSLPGSPHTGFFHYTF